MKGVFLARSALSRVNIDRIYAGIVGLKQILPGASNRVVLETHATAEKKRALAGRARQKQDRA